MTRKTSRLPSKPSNTILSAPASSASYQYKDGEKRYVLLPKDVKVGARVIASETAEITAGNRLPLKNIPVGSFVYNIEIQPKGGAKLVRSAGSFAQVIANDAGYTHIKMPSTEVRKVIDTAWASIGAVSNDENRLVTIGKAGRSRWMGIRPTVRGSAQNPVDHPYGGGEQRTGRGLRRLKTRWGKPAGKGQKTRTPKKYSNVFIVSRRKVGKKKKGRVGRVETNNFLRKKNSASASWRTGFFD